MYVEHKRVDLYMTCSVHARHYYLYIHAMTTRIYILSLPVYTRHYYLYIHFITTRIYTLLLPVYTCCHNLYILVITTRIYTSLLPVYAVHHLCIAYVSAEKEKPEHYDRAKCTCTCV
jgi:hypothetical protein